MTRRFNSSQITLMLGITEVMPYRLERYKEALVAYDKAVQLKPDFPEAWYKRGTTLDDLQRYEDAIAAYDKAVQLKPDYQLAVDNRSRLQAKLGQ